jgi:hypothetical protein
VGLGGPYWSLTLVLIYHTQKLNPLLQLSVSFQKQQIQILYYLTQEVISLSIYLYFSIHRTYKIFFKLHEIINKHVLAYVCYYSFFFKWNSYDSYFFQRYKYFLSDMLIPFMSYLILLSGSNEVDDVNKASETVCALKWVWPTASARHYRWCLWTI